jgi:hypothetical protein
MFLSFSIGYRSPYHGTQPRVILDIQKIDPAKSSSDGTKGGQKFDNPLALEDLIEK